MNNSQGLFLMTRALNNAYNNIKSKLTDHSSEDIIKKIYVFIDESNRIKKNMGKEWLKQTKINFQKNL